MGDGEDGGGCEAEAKAEGARRGQEEGHLVGERVGGESFGGALRRGANEERRVAG